MPDMTASYGIPLDFISLFKEVLQTIDDYSCQTFTYCDNQCTHFDMFTRQSNY